MEIDHVEEHLVNGALMKKYAGQQVRVWLQTSGDTSAGGRQVSKEFSHQISFTHCDSHCSCKV